MTEDREQPGATAPSVLIVVVDVFRNRLARAFRERGYDVRAASRYAEALARAQEDSPEMAVVISACPGRRVSSWCAM